MKNQEDKKTLTGFIITGAFLLLLFVLSLLIEDKAREVLLKENGLIEGATLVSYLACIVLIVYAGGPAFLKQGHVFLVLLILFMLRELDFDKIFTPMSTLKPKFYFSPDVTLLEKLVGAIVYCLLLYAIASIIYHNFASFLSGLKNKSIISIGSLMVFLFLVLSKSLDGIARKVRGLGFELGDRASEYATVVEEIIELGIPILIFLTFQAYFHKKKGSSDI